MCSRAYICLTNRATKSENINEMKQTVISINETPPFELSHAMKVLDVPIRAIEEIEVLRKEGKFYTEISIWIDYT